MVYFLRYETLNIKINGNIRLLDLSLKALWQPSLKFWPKILAPYFFKVTST